MSFFRLFKIKRAEVGLNVGRRVRDNGIVLLPYIPTVVKTGSVLVGGNGSFYTKNGAKERLYSDRRCARSCFSKKQARVSLKVC